MTTRRFQVTRVSETDANISSVELSEISPLFYIEDETAQPPSIPTLSTINEPCQGRMSSRFFNRILRRKSWDINRRNASSVVSSSIGNRIQKSSSNDAIHEFESALPLPIILDEINVEDTSETIETIFYSTGPSTNYDTTTMDTVSSFLQELRSKRRELREKGNNIPIDERIAHYRRRNEQKMIHAQDIFDVHFSLNNDDDNDNDLLLPESKLFTEEFQEKMRTDIYDELNRQQRRKSDKRYRHLLLGRLLLMSMTALLVFMGLILMYAVFDLIGRANNLDAKLPENKFISMLTDTTTNLH